MNIKKTLNKILLPLNILMGAIGLINLADDIVPSFIKFTEVLQLCLEIFEKIRDAIFYPLTFAFDSLFDVEVPDWIKTYLFLGMLLFGALVRSLLSTKLINKEERRIKNILKNLVPFLFFWPIFLLVVLDVFTFKADRKGKHVDAIFLWGKNLLWITIAGTLIVFVNWLWIRITLGIEAIG